MYESVLYFGDEFLGEVEIHPQDEQAEKNGMQEELKEIRITHFSKSSERCPPLAVLHAITSSSSNYGVCFKLESKSTTFDNNKDKSLLFVLHSSCIRENKTAVMPLGDGGQELHLVAMYTRSDVKQYPCFWAFNVSPGLYASCLEMLDHRCLGIVFDLDETLIVANTKRSFEDKIEALQRKLSTEVDPRRISGILAEIKRYQDDRMILKQYAENDQVVDEGKVVETQSEVVPVLSDYCQPFVRPLIRLHEKNIILTRINPQVRDTSVLVRLRPAWENLRKYLIARGRKRFEVYVCTMAERDYALEMWRLLDPDANLISIQDLLSRVVCVRSGLKKSLNNIFQDRTCHPKMSLVIDDRLKVWDENDQPRVHVVPAFAPYYAPQAEEYNAVPVLCVARNVACNVRGGFFKDFDNNLLQRVSEIAYEDDIKEIPSSPDASSYLVSEHDTAAISGIKDPLNFDGMADVEVEERLKEATSSSRLPSLATDVESMTASSIQFPVSSSASSTPLPLVQDSVVPFAHVQYPPTVSPVRTLSHAGPSETTLQSSAKEEGEVPESELDPDTRRRLLILQHGLDTRDHTPSESPLTVKPPAQVTLPRGSWFPVEEGMSPRKSNRAGPKEFHLHSEPIHIEKNRMLYPPFYQKLEGSIPPDRIMHEHQRLSKEVLYRDEQKRSTQSLSSCQYLSGEEMGLVRSAAGNRDANYDCVPCGQNMETPTDFLQEIAKKCGAKLEFRPALVASAELQFSVEAWFAAVKIGDGTGRTRRYAQDKASECALKNLARFYLSRGKSDTNANSAGFMSNLNSFGRLYSPREEFTSFLVSPEASRPMDPRLEGYRRSSDSVSALEELCIVEGLGIAFQPSPSANLAPRDEVREQAAEKTLGNLGSMIGQFPVKRQGSPRFVQGMSKRRSRAEYPRPPQ